MKEYNDAKKDLLKVYRTAKKELADKVRPVFFSQFEQFFKDYPEIGRFRFELATDIYDDENYSSGVQDITFKLAKDYTTDEFRDIEGDYGYEDLVYTMRDQTDEVGESLLSTFSSVERIREVADAAKRMGRLIGNLDVEFLQDTFEEDCAVSVTPAGFEVE